VLGCGSVILGASETAGRLFIRIDALAREKALSLEAAAGHVVSELRVAKQPIPGYGHPQHKARDPRVARLFAVAAEAGQSGAIGGRHVAIAEAVEKVLPGITGRDLKLNVSAAIPAVLLDVGFPADALKGVPMLARVAGLIGHLTEELARPIGFALSYQATRAQAYTGAMPAGAKLEAKAG
jgi:citrate synthase